GGLWIGTYQSGVVYRSGEGEWMVYDTDNSRLPTDYIGVLENDGGGGIWVVGLYDVGLAHLASGQKNTLCADLNDSPCQNLLTNKRAAIIIAGGGHDKTNTLWDTTAAISDYIYKMLNKRGFDNNEIYYLSPQSYADFTGDGLDDCIVDAPATPRCRLTTVENPIAERALIVDDVRNAFAWAKTGGQLDQPLYVFFINHGSTDRFQLSKYNDLEVSEFKDIVDDYQKETGNQVALVIDTCYSGVLLEKLIAPNRAIISSTGNGLAYFDRTNKQGYSRFLAKGLLKGMNFYEAFEYARDKQEELVKSLSIGQDQIPQWYDGSNDGQWLRNLFING
ncbi:two component regulator propeller domain protein, partial [Candidatus Thiomargarita nelsonii]